MYYYQANGKMIYTVVTLHIALNFFTPLLYRTIIIPIILKTRLLQLFEYSLFKQSFINSIQLLIEIEMM